MQRIREVKQHNATIGVFNGGKRPFGFDIGTGLDGVQRLTPNAAEQAKARKMLSLRKKGETYRAIGAAVGIADPKTVKRIIDRWSTW